MLLDIITVVLASLYGVLFCTYIIGWLSLKKQKKISNKFSTKVSVIIPARNEEQNICNCLDDILNQNFPKELLEIIVVDDHSTDKTVEQFNLIKQKINSDNQNLQKAISLKLIQLENNNAGTTKALGKKSAISTAIKSSTGELIITTDADCRMNSSWIASIVSYYEIFKPQLISSPVNFNAEKNFFQQIQGLEFAGLIGIGAAAIKVKTPNMCNGANLAYQKSAFNIIDGFEGFDNIASGDDLFLLYKISKKYPDDIHFLKSLNATVLTSPQKNIKDFFQQRKRWVSKSTEYSSKWATSTALLVYLFNITIIINLGRLLFYNLYEPFLLQISIKFVFEFVFLYLVTDFFNKKKLLFLFIPAQFLHIIYVVFIVIYGNFGTYNWKGRTVNN